MKYTTSFLTFVAVCIMGVLFWMATDTSTRNVIKEVIYYPARGLSKMSIFGEETQTANFSSKYPKWISSFLPTGVTDLKDANMQTLYNIYYSFSDAVEIPCMRKVRLGRLGDGGWDVCDDYALQPRKPCLIYSFGINNEWSFDDASEKWYQCEIHSFDPSMSAKDHNRSKLVHFHKIGLSGSDKNGKWKMRTLTSIKKELGHADRILDVLKMDIEGSEWASLPQSADDSSLRRVKQLSVEFHINNARQHLTNSITTLLKLYSLGFRKFYTHKNPACPNNVKGYKGSLTVCAEANYLNTAFQP